MEQQFNVFSEPQNKQVKRYIMQNKQIIIILIHLHHTDKTRGQLRSV